MRVVFDGTGHFLGLQEILSGNQWPSCSQVNVSVSVSITYPSRHLQCRWENEPAEGSTLCLTYAQMEGGVARPRRHFMRNLKTGSKVRWITSLHKNVNITAPRLILSDPHSRWAESKVVLDVAEVSFFYLSIHSKTVASSREVQLLLYLGTGRNIT